MGHIINDYLRRESDCEMQFNYGGPFWHLFTPGEVQEIIFTDRDDFGFGITSMAMALKDAETAGLNVNLYSFALMTNHAHLLLAGPREDCIECFGLWKSRLKRYFSGRVNLEKFECSLTAVPDLRALRGEIAYIHRNGFVNNLKENPFSYEWSSGMYYFNPATKFLSSVKIADLKYRDRQQLLKARIVHDFDAHLAYRGYISPRSFCNIDKGESFFRDAHQYFYAISRNSESYSMIARTLGDRVFLNDEEMFGVVCRKAKELFNIDRPKLLNQSEKIEVARIMHKDYNASNGQITRMLKLEKAIVEELFPKPV